MLSIRMETDTKYYVAHLMRDLFDDLVLVCDYGSKTSKHAHRITRPVASESEAESLCEKIIKTRYNHGYDLV